MMKKLIDGIRSLFTGQRKYRTAVMGTVGLLCVCAVAVGLRAGSVKSFRGERRILPLRCGRKISESRGGNATDGSFRTEEKPSR